MQTNSKDLQGVMKINGDCSILNRNAGTIANTLADTFIAMYSILQSPTKKSLHCSGASMQHMMQLN